MLNFLFHSRTMHAVYACILAVLFLIGAGCFLYVGINVPAPFDDGFQVIPQWLWNVVFIGNGLTMFGLAGYFVFRFCDELAFEAGDRGRMTGKRKVPAKRRYKVTWRKSSFAER
jgi:hypothetical protein